MSLVVGLDIGTKTLTGAVFSGNAKSLRLVDFFAEEMPSVEQTLGTAGDVDAESAEELDTPPSLEEFLDRVLTERGLKQADVVAGIDTKDCVVRELLVPFAREEQVAATIAFEAESHFPGIDLENDVTLEYLKVGESEGKTQLIVWALPNEKIEERLGLLKSVDIDPVALDLDAAALFNAFALTPTFDPERTTLLVEMGTTSTKILLIEGGRLRKTRALRLRTTPLSPDRLIPEPPREAEEGISDSRPSSSSAPAGIEGFSIESRFQEIEQALSRLTPVEDRAEDHGPGASESEATIAILTDEQYDLVREAVGEAEDDPSLLLSEESQPVGKEDAAPEDAGPPHGDAGPSPVDAGGTAGGFPGAQEASFDYGSYLERIGQEIQRSLAGVHLSSPIELICLTGGMSGHEETRRYFAEEFDVETIDLDFGDSFDTDLPPEQHAEVGRLGGVAVGLAAKALGEDKVGLDFRKGPYRYEHKLVKLRFSLLVAASLFFLFSLQATYFAFQSWKEEKQRTTLLQAYEAKSYEVFFGEALIAGLTPLEAARKKRDAWKKGGGGDKAQYLPPAELIHNLGTVMNSLGFHFKIEELNLRFRANPARARKGSGRRSRGRGPKFTVDSSTMKLVTPHQDPTPIIETAFNQKQESKIFNATTSKRLSRGKSDEIQVNVTLKVKPGVLNKL